MDQVQRATKNKIEGERRMFRALSAWAQDITANYRIGDDTQDSTGLLLQTLKQQYIKTVNKTLGIDTREYKEVNYIDEALRRVSVVMTDKMTNRLPNSSTQINQTTNGLVKRVTDYAIVDNMTQREADIMLSNYLRSQRLTIATTETQWIVETARNVAVVQVLDPIGNSVEQIAALLDQGRFAEARKLSKDIMRLTKLPLSEGQADVLNYINDNREDLMTPLTQGGKVSSMRRRAAELGADEKSWVTMGDGKVRDSHAEANGQKRKIDEPFTVGGYSLMHPGDTSMGASLSEVINCRCVTRYGKKRAA